MTNGGHDGVEMKGPEAWARRARALGVDAPPGSETWQVAMVLQAAVELGQNIDRLVRRTGAARPQVSKWARRLVDNGVWSEGQTVAQWTADATAGAAFQQDIAVATGRLLRRIGANGRMEWAEAGRWNKSFEREDDEAAPGTTYHDAAPREAEPIALAEEMEVGKGRVPRPVVQADATEAEAEGSQESVAGARAAAVAEGGTEPGEAIHPPSSAVGPLVESAAAGRAATGERSSSEPVEEEEEDGDAPSLEQVFSNAVWLR